MIDVAGLGYCVYDVLAIVPLLPDFDDVQMVHVPDLVMDGGGQVGTALTALARLGARCGYLGLLGDDHEGRWLATRLQDNGIDTQRLRLSPDAGTNICLILVHKATAQRAILCHPRVTGGDLVLTETDRSYIQKAQVLHLDGQFMPAAIQAARWAQEAGVRVCYDGNHPRPDLEQLLPMVDWLVVAQSFPEAWTGLNDPHQAAARLLNYGIDLLLVTLGARGCECWTETSYFRLPGWPVQAVDTTGAGDAFHGAFIYGMLQDWGLRQVVAFANAAGALNCLTLGGQRGLPTLSEVQKLLMGEIA